VNVVKGDESCGVAIESFVDLTKASLYLSPFVITYESVATFRQDGVLLLEVDCRFLEMIMS